MLAALAVLSGVAVHAADQPPAAATPAPVKIVLHYFGKAYDEPVPLSLVDLILTDNGVQGARLGIQDNNKSGQFLGQDYLSHDLASEVAFMEARGTTNPLRRMTVRELQTLALVAEGKPYGVIAEHLHVSYKTVANTCTQLKAKLGVRTLPELMRIAIQHLPSTSVKSRE